MMSSRCRSCLLSVWIAGLALAGCAPQQDEQHLAQKSQLEATLAAEREANSRTVAHLQSEIKKLLDENVRLREQVEMLQLTATPERAAQLQRRVGELEAELQRYRSGLESAVGELNRQAQQHREQQSAARSPLSRQSSGSERRSRKEECCIHVYDPYIVHVGATVTVSGDLENTRSTDTGGQLTVELLDGSEVVDSKTIDMEIPAKLRESYEIQFTFMQPDGNYRARGFWTEGN